MIKKTRKIIVALVFILSIFGMLTFNSQVNADETCQTREVYFGTEGGKQIIISDEPGLEYTNILTDAEFKIYTPDGNLMTEPITNVSNGSTFTTKINFEIDECIRGLMEDGDYFEFQIEPDGIKFDTEVTKDLLFNDKKIGEVTLYPDGKVRLTFNSELENHNDISGFFNVSGVIDVGESGEPGDVKIKIPTREEDSKTVNVTSSSDTLIKKEGRLDRENNPTKIYWDVFVNQNYSDLKNAKVVDKIPDGLTYNNVKVYEAIFNHEGTLVSVSDTPLSNPSDYQVNITDDGVEVVLGNITTPYLVVYETDIDDADALDKETFDVENTATLIATDINKNSKTEITAPFDKFIDKESIDYDRANGIITWQVIYNAREASLPISTTATDIYDSRLAYIENSMTITKADGTTEVDFDVVNTAANHKLDITFNEEIDSKIIITYQTKIDKDQINVDSMTFTNTFTSEGVTGEGETTIGQGNVSKDGEIVDYVNQLIDYTITVNANKYTMKNLVIEDNYSFFGLETKNRPVIKDKDGNNELEEGVDYNYVDRGVDGFTITMIGAYANFNTTLEITFQSKYTTDNIDDGDDPEGKNNTVLRNQAKVTFKDHNDNERKSTSTKDIEPRHEVLNNGKKDGSYNDETKEITWRVFVNYNGYELKNASIVDQISDDQKLVKNSLVLKTFKVNPTTGDITVNEDEIISLEDKDISDYDSNKVEVKLPNTSERYMLEFKTSLEGMIVKNEFTNTAQFINDGTTKNLTGKVNPKNGGKFVSKGAKQNETTINWAVDVNLSRSTVFDAKVTDMPTSNVVLDRDSLKVYKYIFEDGVSVIDRDNPLVENTDYTIEWTSDGDKRGFELSFSNVIKDAYRLEYNTEINTTEDNLRVENKVIFTGSNEDSELTQENEGFVVINPDLAAGAIGTQSNLSIVKYERGTTTPIPGARIQLINSKGNVVGDEITGENGEINFPNRVRGTYILKEIEAPEGYHISKELHEGITVKIPNKDGDNEVAFKIYNDANKVIVSKLNIDEDRLDGAQFNLEVKNEEGNYVPYDNKTYTSEDGGFNITHLPLGEYRLVEIGAVDGYILNTQPYEFVVEADKAGFVETGKIDFINYQGNVKLTKYGIDSDNEKSLLEGAIFELYKVGEDEDELIGDDYSTSKEGILEVTGLAPGDYYFIEKSSNDGFIADKNPINFTIASEFEGEPDLIELEANNYKANVSFNKVDSYGNPMDNVIFELQKFNSQSESYETIDTYTSIEGVVQVSNLSPGDYQFIETETVEGFILNTEPIKFTVGNSIMDQTELTITLDDFINHQGKIAIEKRDVDSKKLIDGAKFSLYTSDDKLVEKNITTKNGKIVIEKLAPGKYYIVETKAPSGYIKSEKQFSFEIVAEFAGQPDVETIKITNKEDALPIVGVDSSAIALLLITISSLVGLRYYYRNN